MYKNENVSIVKLLLNNNKVNNYTKLMIYLNTLNYYEDYYIPNKKLMKMLNINKPNCIRLLSQLKKDRIITIFYKGKKRYFTFIANLEEEKEEKLEIEQYNWLED